MKRRYRERALNELYERLGSQDFDEREHALFQLAKLLRRAKSDKANDDLPGLENDSLPRELQRIRLGKADQIQIVEALKRLIKSRRESRATALWALAKADAELAWDALAALLADLGGQLDDEAAYQACRALGKWLATGRIGERKRSDIARLLSAWAGSPQRRLAKQASAALEACRLA